MTYNGIGLQTARGSGTNGYVQANLANVFLPKQKSSYLTEEDIKKAEAEINRKPNQDLLIHEKKRRVELKCMELQDLMEEQGYKADEIDQKVNEYRTLLLEQLNDGGLEPELDSNGRPMASNTHEKAELMSERKNRMRSALGIKSDFIEGSSLDKLNPKKAATTTTETDVDAKKGWEERFEHENRNKPAGAEEVETKRASLIEKVEKTTEKKKRASKRSADKNSKKKRRRQESSSSSSSSETSSSDSDSSESDSESSSSSSEDEKAHKKKSSKVIKKERDVSPTYKDRRRITSPPPKEREEKRKSPPVEERRSPSRSPSDSPPRGMRSAVHVVTRQPPPSQPPVPARSPSASPPRRRRSPSPDDRRDKSPSPPRRRPNRSSSPSASPPRRRRSSPSPKRRRDSRSPPPRRR